MLSIPEFFQYPNFSYTRFLTTIEFHIYQSSFSARFFSCTRIPPSIFEFLSPSSFLYPNFPRIPEFFLCPNSTYTQMLLCLNSQYAWILPMSEFFPYPNLKYNPSYPNTRIPSKPELPLQPNLFYARIFSRPKFPLQPNASIPKFSTTEFLLCPNFTCSQFPYITDSSLCPNSP